MLDPVPHLLSLFHPHLTSDFDSKFTAVYDLLDLSSAYDPVYEGGIFILLVGWVN